MAEPLTLHVFAENRSRVPLENCCILLIPFSHGSEEMTSGLLWSGPLTADLGAPLLPSREVRHRQQQQQREGRQSSEEEGHLGPSQEALDIVKLKRRGAVLCHRLSLLPCVPGVYHVAAGLLCRPQHTVYWHHKPLRLLV